MALTISTLLKWSPADLNTASSRMLTLASKMAELKSPLLAIKQAAWQGTASSAALTDAQNLVSSIQTVCDKILAASDALDSGARQIEQAQQDVVSALNKMATFKYAFKLDEIGNVINAPAPPPQPTDRLPINETTFWNDEKNTALSMSKKAKDALIFANVSDNYLKNALGYAFGVPGAKNQDMTLVDPNTPIPIQYANFLFSTFTEGEFKDDHLLHMARSPLRSILEGADDAFIAAASNSPIVNVIRGISTVSEFANNPSAYFAQQRAEKAYAKKHPEEIFNNAVSAFFGFDKLRRDPYRWGAETGVAAAGSIVTGGAFATARELSLGERGLQALERTETKVSVVEERTATSDKPNSTMNKALNTVIENNFRSGSSIGNGSTMGALREEIKNRWPTITRSTTGKTRITFHDTKTNSAIRAVKNLLDGDGRFLGHLKGQADQRAKSLVDPSVRFKGPQAFRIGNKEVSTRLLGNDRATAESLLKDAQAAEAEAKASDYATIKSQFKAIEDKVTARLDGKIAALGREPTKAEFQIMVESVRREFLPLMTAGK